MIAFFGPGGYEWIIVLIIALLLFGRRLPQVMKSMGEGVRMFKKGVGGEDDDVDDAYDEEVDGPYANVDSEEDPESTEE